MLYLERRPHHAPTRLHQFPGATTTAALTRGIGVSPRRLSQRFQQAVQFMHLGADIHWAELGRTRPHLRLLRPVPFINDFHAFSGLSPTSYSTANRPWANHISITSEN
jgi:hypothetical protein